LTQESALTPLPSGSTRRLCLDRDWSVLAGESALNPLAGASAEDLAYVMYTSGSTGRPKGVCVTHRNVVRLTSASDYLTTTGDDVFLGFGPISFDASTFELWSCLLNGARLALFADRWASLEELGGHIQREGVTTLFFTAALFRQMVDSSLSSLEGVRQLLSGGEAPSTPQVLRAHAALPGCRLIHCYGPTENTTFTTTYPIQDVTQITSSVPIGRPLANTQVFVLDKHLNPAPRGAVGELYAA